MSQIEPTSPQTMTSQTVDLASYDREPLHLPGSIQPHGVLLVLSEPDLTIVQLSRNSAQGLGYEPEELLNQPLSRLLSVEQLDLIRGCLSQDFEKINPLKISLETPSERIVLDGIIHRSTAGLILELEPAQSAEPIHFFGFYHLVKGTIAKLQNAHRLSDMCDVIVKEVRQLTGFDRVMVYQFDETGVGRVVAEDKQEEMIAYRGLHYPATDIPEAAKQLFALNWVRLIPDVNYEPVALIPSLHPLVDQPTDLSYATLRSASPCHIEYLQNMGVSASMTISLLKNKRLWGLIACHHNSRRHLSYQVRTVCEFLGQVFSLELNAKEENEDLDYKMKLKSIQSTLVEVIPQSDSLLDGLLNSEANLLDLVNATGAAICWDDQFYPIGQTPDPEQLAGLLEWVEAQLEGNLFSTATLPKLCPEAEAFRTSASGVLALAISRIKRVYILWFRPEVVQTVAWGGDPHQALAVSGGEVGSEALRLSPRKSFAAWKETVRGQSLPWKPCEIAAVLELRSAIVGIVLRQADELAKINLELERSNSELDSFAYIASHDLKEPLRGIHNYSSFLIEDYADVLNEDGVSKLQTLVRLTQRMEDLINSLLHFSRLGRVELDLKQTDLNELVQTVLDVLRISLEQKNLDIRIPRPLPLVLCDRVQMSEVFTNLISNAIKYNDREQKTIEIGYLDPVRAMPKRRVEDTETPELITTIYIKDNGIGIPEHHLDNIFRIFKRLHGPTKYGGGTGAGLTIAKKIVERHGGTIWVESSAGAGSAFYFTIPAAPV